MTNTSATGNLLPVFSSRPEPFDVARSHAQDATSDFRQTLKTAHEQINDAERQQVSVKKQNIESVKRLKERDTTATEPVTTASENTALEIKQYASPQSAAVKEKALGDKQLSPDALTIATTEKENDAEQEASAVLALVSLNTPLQESKTMSGTQLGANTAENLSEGHVESTNLNIVAGIDNPPTDKSTVTHSLLNGGTLDVSADNVFTAQQFDAINLNIKANGSLDQQTSAPIASGYTTTINSVVDLTTTISLAGDVSMANTVAIEEELDKVSLEMIGTHLPKSDAEADQENISSLNNKLLASATEADKKISPLSDDTEKLTTTFEKMLQAVTVSRSGDDVSQPLDGDLSLPSKLQNAALAEAGPALNSFQQAADSFTPAARTFVVQTSIPVPLGQPQWSQAVGERVLWLAAQNVSSAEMHLHPQDLGPMQVNVSVKQDQVTIHFTSQHALVREVLDQNMNKLRDMFTEQGLNLVNVYVSQQTCKRQQQESKNQSGPAGLNASSGEEAPVAVSAIVMQRLVDQYA